MAMSSLRKHIHKDYIKRAQAYNQKKKALQKLKRKAALRNPEEFYLKRIKTKKFGVFYTLKRRTNKYPEDDLEYILLKKVKKEIDVELEKINLEREEVNLELERVNLEVDELNLELEEVNADIEVMTSEANELRKLLYELRKRKENAPVENPNQFIDDGVLKETQGIGGS